METYVETQNRLLKFAQEEFGDERMRIDAVTFNGKEFVVFANTHASSWPQTTTYVGPGARGYKEMISIIEGK